MRLIDADRLYNTIIDEIDPISISMDGGEMRGMMRTIIAAEPTVDAAPLDKLCEFLVKCGANSYCGTCKQIMGECFTNGNGCGSEYFWKELLTRWMEGLK